MKLLTRCVFFLLLTNTCFAQQPSLVLPLGHTSWVNGTVFSPDAKYTLSYGNSPEVFLWETNTGKLIHVFKANNSGRIKYAAFSPDGKYIVAQAIDMFDATLVWNTDNGEIVYKPSWNYDIGAEDKIFFPGNSERIIFGESGENGNLEVGDLKTGKTIIQKRRDSGEIFQFANNNLWIISDGKVTAWNIDSNKPAKTIAVKELKGTIQKENIKISTSGKYLFYNTHGTITVISLTTGNSLLEFVPKLTHDELADYDKYYHYEMYTVSEDEKLLLWYSNDSLPSGKQEIKGFNLESKTYFSYLLDSSKHTYLYGDIPIIHNNSFFILSTREKNINKRKSYTNVLTKCNLYTGKKERQWIFNNSVFSYIILGEYLLMGMDERETLAEIEPRSFPVVKIINLISDSIVATIKGNFDKRAFLSEKKELMIVNNEYHGPIGIPSFWHLEPSKEIATMKGNNAGISTFMFLDTNLLFINNRIVNIKNGTIMQNFPGTYKAFNDEATIVLMERNDSLSELYNTGTGKLIGKVYGGFEAMDSLKFLITTLNDSTNFIWNYRTAKKITALKGMIESSIYDEEETNLKYLVLLARDSSPIVYNFSSGITIPIKGKYSKISESEKYILTNTGKVLNAYSIKTGKLTGMEITKDYDGLAEMENKYESIPVDKKKYFHSETDSVGLRSVQSIENNKFVIGIYDDDSVIIKSVTDDFQSAKIKLLITSPENRIFGKRWDHLSISPDKRFLFLNDLGDIAYVEDLYNGNRFPIPLNSYERIKACRFSKNDSILYIWSKPPNNTNEPLNHSFTAYRIKSGTKIFSTGGDPKYPLFAFNFEKNVVAISSIGKIQLFDTEKGTLLYDYVSLDSTDYIITDNKGHYDGTPAAMKLLIYTCGTEIIELDQLKDRLWEPRLAERIMSGETINAKTLDELNICNLTPQIEDVSTKEEYHFKITPRRGGLGETILSVNGNPTKILRAEQLIKNNGVYELLIRKEELSNFFIAGVENTVTVKAKIADNTISSRGVKITGDKTKAATTPPNLYAVMVGISDYKGDELDLKFAAKDATDISSAVSNAAKKLLNTDGKEHVFMYNLTTAKEHDFLPEKNSIKKVLQEIGEKATANDVLLIFFAGHGIMEGEKKQFYFLTADASKISATAAIADVGISTAELAEWMKPENIKAQKRILIFDACNSGQAINDMVANQGQNYLAGRSDDKAQQIKAIDKLNEKSGLFILCASASNQSAYEMGRYSQGLLTYSLLKAIKQQPDILDDGKYLDVSRWFNAAQKTVSDVSKENGARQEPQIVTNTNFNIGIVDAEVIAKIRLAQEKPLFTASNFQNADEKVMADDLGFNKIVDQKLNEISSRDGEETITYAAASNSPDAYTLSGRYAVTGNTLKLKIIIRQNNAIKKQFELSGKKDALNDLAATLVEQSAKLVK